MKSGRKELCTLIYKWRRIEYVVTHMQRLEGIHIQLRGIFTVPPWYYLEYFYKLFLQIL